MKKFVTVFICMLVVLSITSVCSAGDIPEALLWSDKAQVYFGEIKALDGDSITVIQRKNIKGEFTQDSELTYKRFGFTESPKIGVIYLCGYFDQNNPLYVWDVSSMDTKTLIIKNAGDMSKRMQDYLNAGKFEVKEEERLAKIKTQTDPA